MIFYLCYINSYFEPNIFFVSFLLNAFSILKIAFVFYFFNKPNPNTNVGTQKSLEVFLLQIYYCLTKRFVCMHIVRKACVLPLRAIISKL